MLTTDDMLSRVRLVDLYPPFAATLRLLVARCRDRGALYVCTSGLRSYAEQDKIYAQGRTTPGGIVTKAKAGYSLHNFGISADFSRDRDDNAGRPGLKIDDRESQYVVLAEEAEKLGLESGLRWRTFVDPNHVQLPITKHGIDLVRLRRELVLGDYQTLYRFLDSITWFAT